MKLSDLKPHDDLLREQLSSDPALSDEWGRTALARAVAVKVLAFRVERGISQRQLAAELGMKQPQVARLESGEVNPTFETLTRLATALGIVFRIDVTPDGVVVDTVVRAR